jgi:hypothetical protein
MCALVAAPMGMNESANRSVGVSAMGSGTSSDNMVAHIPIAALADIDFKTGPPSIRTENGQLVGFVFVDIDTDDLNGYVRGASERIRQQVQFPAGYYIQWAGQFQYLQEAEKRLKIVIPFTLLIIFVLIYMNTNSVAKTFIVLLAVPFSLVGAFWFLYLLGYNMSVAVWVGLIALAGLDAETGVVMLLYLDHAWEKFRAEGRMRTVADLNAAVIEGAVQRIRPKIMTICAILFGLLPIMWSPTTQSGADVMKRIAAPMIGGVVTSGILELLIYPAVFALWRRRHLPPETRDSRETIAAWKHPRSRRTAAVALLTLVALAVVGYFAWQKFGRTERVARVQLTEPQANAVKKFFVAADAISSSLAGDNLDGFNKTAEKAPAAATELTQTFDSSHPWHGMVQQVASVSNLPKAQSLEEARKAFAPFTARVAEFAMTARHQSQAVGTVKIYQCPMAPKAGQTSYWIQLQGPLRNPFYGSEMIDCGSEVAP